VGVEIVPARTVHLASWLNMTEIEISLLERQYLGRRLMDRATAQREVDAWQRQRNAERRRIEWTFTRQDADRRLGDHYVSYLTCCCTRTYLKIVSTAW
jgi:hypothetical protein